MALSSDAFSKWLIDDAQAHNSEVMKNPLHHITYLVIPTLCMIFLTFPHYQVSTATKRLEDVIIKDCASYLDKYYRDVPLDNMELSDELTRLINQIHRRGARHFFPSFFSPRRRSC